jgi:hypothetical protein
MTRVDFEFPTEWSLCPDVKPQDERTQPPKNANAQDQELKAAEPRQEPRVFAAGGSGPSSR